MSVECRYPSFIVCWSFKSATVHPCLQNKSIVTHGHPPLSFDILCIPRPALRRPVCLPTAPTEDLMPKMFDLYTHSPTSIRFANNQSPALPRLTRSATRTNSSPISSACIVCHLVSFLANVSNIPSSVLLALSASSKM